ncbi:hypothetical protein GCK32_000481 [Trichostrongylus colubriformis]|uniref:ShKT domain-containing protein n=1 Tax=Trichostrongylus colubriformis TaxID=6319 RepID=A0AAN8EVF0_TRICO
MLTTALLVAAVLAFSLTGKAYVNHSLDDTHLFHGLPRPRKMVKRQTQCGTNANCPHWVNNGFCNSTFYNNAQKTMYCGRQCGLC